MEKVSSGKILNLMSVDTQRLGDLMSYIHIAWSAPYQTALISVMLYKQLGVASLAGIGLLLVSVPVTSEVTRHVRKIQKSLMRCKDDRARVTAETLSGIRAVKMYAWEEAKVGEITEIRRTELTHLWRSQLVLVGFTINNYHRLRYSNQLINRVQTFAVPCLVAVLSFCVYTKGLGNNLTPAATFTSIALFNMLRFPLIVLPNVVMSLAEAFVTVSRIRVGFMSVLVDANIQLSGLPATA